MKATTRNALLSFLLGVVVVCAMRWLASHPSDEETSQAEYCRMVEMYQQDPTRTTGWPDFSNNYDEVCKDAR